MLKKLFPLVMLILVGGFIYFHYFAGNGSAPGTLISGHESSIGSSEKMVKKEPLKAGKEVQAVAPEQLKAPEAPKESKGADQPEENAEEGKDAEVAEELPVLQLGQRYDVKPFRLYRTEDGKPAEVRFTDAAGRELFFGYYPKNALVTSPAGAEKSNIPLKEVSPEEEKIEIGPDFWVETSKLVENKGSDVTVRPYGYAVSIPVPLQYGLNAKIPKDFVIPDGMFKWATPSIIWYDADMNFLATAGKRPDEAVFQRFFCPYGPSNHAMYLYLIKGKDKPALFKRDPVPLHPGEIVLSPGCSICERFAAVELARTVRIITKKRLVIVSKPTPGAAFHIFMGRAFAEKRFQKELKRLEGTEGYALRKKGNDIYAFGAKGRGSIYAMARLLDDNTDFIYYRPDPRIGYSFTPLKAVKFERAGSLSKPAFPLRTWSGPGIGCRDYDLWLSHNFSCTTYSFGIRHNSLFSASNYRSKELGHYCYLYGNYMELPFSIEKKPEHYPMINGRRMVGTTIGQPCYSNPEVVKNTLTAVRNMLKEVPEELDFFEFSYSDSWQCCECPECMKPIPLPDGKELRAKSVVPQDDPWFRSTRTMMIANLIAQEVDKARPGVPTRLLAYIYTAANPAVKPDPHLKIIFASYDTSNMRFPLRKQTNGAMYAPESWAYRFKKWIQDSPGAMGMYEYFFTSIPAMFAEAAAENMKDITMSPGGGWDFHSQTQGDDHYKSIESFGTNADMWSINSMDQWIISHLMWDPTKRVRELRAEFLRRVYREGAEEMDQYCKLFGKKWFDPTCGTFINCHTSASSAYTSFITKAKIEKQLYELIKKAKEKTSSPGVKRHLELKADALRRMKESRGVLEIPRIDELASAWKNYGSPHWNRAMALRKFRVPFNFDWKNNFSKAKTELLLGADKKYLYFRVTSDAKMHMRQTHKEEITGGGDSIELRFKREGKNRIFQLSGSGTFCDMENWETRWDSNWDVRFHPLKNGWGATGRIPMQAVRSKPESDLKILCLRTTEKGELSFARSDQNRSDSFPTNNGGNFSTCELDVKSKFDSKLNPVRKPAKPIPQDKMMENILAKKAFSISPGKTYLVNFEASVSELPVPPLTHMLEEASIQNRKLFWHWKFHITFKDGSYTIIDGPCKNIISGKNAKYTDVFIAPPNADKVQLRFSPPDFSHPSEISYRGFRIREYNPKSILNLNWDFYAGNACTNWDSYMPEGTGMRTVNGKRVFDTGYGVMSRSFPLEAGKPYVLTGKRTVYGWYTAYEVLLMDAKGKWLKWVRSGDRNQNMRLRFIPMPGTTHGLFRIYSSYLEWCRVEPESAVLEREAKEAKKRPSQKEANKH